MNIVGNAINVLDARAVLLQTESDRLEWELVRMPDAVEALLFGSRDDSPVLDKNRRAIVVVRRV
jgi:hypothetical protein